MISINSLTVAFGGFTLLDNINFHISENDKIGLVGKNGAGKSTLLKLICGQQTPTAGKVEVPGGMAIGYLPQIMQHHRGRTVMEEALTAFAKLFEMEAQLEAINVELAERTDYESEAYSGLIVRMNELNDHLAVLRSDDPNVLAERTLKGLGFKSEELSRPTETFSQGWNMRIELAKILLGSPDILLLDEPTNHLDIESIEWLENYLKEYRGSLVLISHDRKFLDNVTNRTVEIMLGHIHDYKVPYSQYQVLRAERIAQQRAAYENQQRMIEKTEEFIERFRYKPTKSNQVQSRVKALEKLERIEVDIEDKAAMTVKFPPAPRSGDIVFKAADLVAGYPSTKPGDKPKVVFSDAQIEVMRGEKVALVGRNGEGKTTLMRILMRELDPLDGEAKTGYNVNIGYYAQNQEDVLDKQDTVFGTLDRIAVGDIRTKLRDILAAFLFKGEDIDKKVAVLSGGERARLAMAKLMLHPYNLLALDEPTNHMDILSKDILKQALKRYDGTLSIVSHDRDFLEGLVDKVYEFRDGRVKEHLGGINEFLRSRKIESLSELERKNASQPAQGSKTQPQGSPKSQAPAKSAPAPAPGGNPKFLSKEQRKLKNRVDFLEKSIAQLEAAQKEIETHLQAPGPSDDIIELTRKYLENKREIDNQTEEWLELSQQL
ncbi:MAG: ABC-F family ATP-binding cassette domain-containing protein [Bacteroidales bacterium]|nr:ABC-F family ATP-binding cassette domain-containing protein [Bacteroidales bacterium]